MRLGIDLRCLAEGEAGGIALYARELLTRLPAHLPQATLTGLHTGLRPPKGELPFPVRRVRVPNKLLNASLVGAHWPAVDRFVNADVFFAPTPKYLALRPHTRFVLTIHDVSFIQHPTYFTPRQRVWHHWLKLPRLLARADAILAVSQHTAADLAQLYPEMQERTHVIYSGADHVPAGPFAPLPSLPPTYILAFAPREARKNIATLRRAHARAFTGHGVPLVLVGSGAGETDAAVLALPHLSVQDRWRALANAHLFLYPSVYEGFGFPPLEAMQLGVPVVAAHVTSIPEVCGDAALLVDPWDPADMARAIETVVQQPDVRSQLIAAGHETAKRYTWDETAKQTARVIHTVYAHRD